MSDGLIGFAIFGYGILGFICAVVVASDETSDDGEIAIAFFFGPVIAIPVSIVFAVAYVPIAAARYVGRLIQNGGKQ